MTFKEGFAFVAGAFVLAAVLALVNGWAILWAWSVLHPATALPMNVVNICAIAVAYYTLKGIFSGGSGVKVKG